MGEPLKFNYMRDNLGKIVGHVPTARATLVFVEGYVEHPIQ